MSNKIELLAPAGDMLSLKSAVNSGCNAVYLGGKNFNARSSANNFSNEELEEIVDYCALRNVKVFLTVNTLYKESELEMLFEFLNKMYTIGIHAFIVQDIGVGMFIKKYFPKVALHASTQMNAHSLNDVLYLESIGFDRVILARELTISEITEIKGKAKIEIEVFGHGALCVSYSGQCLMSSFIGGRSGNRGKCAGTCRLQFDLLDENHNPLHRGYLLSTKDLHALSHINELKKIGVNSIKLEGRMKSYEYVGQITKTYRQAIDGLTITEKEYDNIKQIFNRGGSLSTGYLENKKSIEMMSIETPKSTGVLIGEVIEYDNFREMCTIALKKDVIAGDGIEIWTTKKPHVGCAINKPAGAKDKIKVKIKGEINTGDKVYRSYDKSLIDSLKHVHKDVRQEVINGSIKAVLGEKIELIFWNDNVLVSTFGDVVERAEKAPLTAEKILEKISKTGGTPFKVDFKNNIIDEDIYVNVSSLNNLRRVAIDLLEKKIIENVKREKVSIESNLLTSNFKETDENTAKYITLQISNFKNFNEIIKIKPFRIYVEYCKDIKKDLNKYLLIAKEEGVEFYIALPKISKNETERELLTFISELEKLEIYVDGFLVSNYGQLKLFDNKKYGIVYDYNLNVFNHLSLEHLTTNNRVATLSPELSINDLNQFANEFTEVIIHGKLPMMITEQCPVGLYIGEKQNTKYCKQRYHNKTYKLSDRMEEKYNIKCNCDFCFAEILANKPIFTLNKADEVKKVKSKYLRLVITDEDDVVELLVGYNSIFNNEKDNNLLIEKYKKIGITNARLYKGVE